MTMQYFIPKDFVNQFATLVQSPQSLRVSYIQYISDDSEIFAVTSTRTKQLSILNNNKCLY